MYVMLPVKQHAQGWPIHLLRHEPCWNMVADLCAQSHLESLVLVSRSCPWETIFLQLPNIKYKPTTVIATAGESSAVFDKHLRSLRESYGEVVAINLINHKGTGGG